MKRIILCLSLFAFFGSQAQQINPVPDYVFRNQMSVGRNAVTDTAAYISIGPRYGANKGLMPPIVSDTSAITGVKRNGLLIFSVQRNNFQYWDSINSRWTSVTANVDTTIISTRAWRKKGDDSLGAVIATRTDTTLLSTRAWRQKGDDSLASLISARLSIADTASMLNPYVRGSGTSDRIPKWSANTRTLIDGSIVDLSTTERMRITSGGDVGIGTSSPSNARLVVSGSSAGTVGAIMSTDVAGTTSFVRMLGDVASQNLINWQDGTALRFATSNQNYSTFAERMRIFANGRVGVNTTTDAGYQFDVAGSIRNTTGAAFATSSGSVGIGTTSPSEVLHVVGRGRFTTIDSTSSPINVLTSDVNGVIRKAAPGVQGSGTTNYIPKFTASGTVGNSQIFDNGTNVGLGTTSPSSILHMNGGTGLAHFRISEATTTRGFLGVANGIISGYSNELALRAELGLILSGTGNAVSAYINSSGGELIIANGNTDLGDYKLQVNGNIYTSSGGVMAASSGEILIGTTVDVGDYRLQVNGNANFRDDVLIDTNLRVNRHISLDQTPKAWALGNAIEGPQGSTLFVAGGGVQTLANVYYDGSYKYSTSNPGAAMFLLQSGITFATYGSGTANGALTGANEMVYAGGELRVGIADQGTFKLQVADKSYFGDEVQIASTTDLGNYKLQVTGEAIITAGIRTDAPSGGTAATWKLGTVATVSPTSPNRTIEVEIGGTTYYIHAKTTNN